MSDPATQVPAPAPVTQRPAEAPPADAPVAAAATLGQPRPAVPMPPARRPFVVLTALAFAMVIVGMVLLWQQHMQLEESSATRPDVGALREQVRGLQQRIAQLEQRPAPLAAQAVDVRPLETRLSALEQRPAASAGADPALAGRVAALDQRLAQAEQQGARAARLARLQRAALALEAGQPLGDVPSTPIALARYATTPPPTEAALRLAFADAAGRARAASRDDEGAGIADRVWARLRGLVTVREGDVVLVGSPAAIVLGHAAQRLGAGDLAGAVATLDALDPYAAEAIAGWRAQAGGLLAARAALAQMLAD